MPGAGQPGEPPVVGVTDFYRVEGEEIHEVAVGPSTPASSSRGISASSATASRSSTWRSRSAISTAASSERWSAGRTSGRSTRWRRWPATRRSAMRRPTARRSRRWPAARSRSGPRCCAASPWSWNGWPTTPATSGPWPATSGFLPTASYCGRLRGDFLNLTALLCGSRFGRGLVRPGGVGFDLDADRERAVPGTPGGGVPRRRQRGQPALELRVGAGPVRGHGSGLARRLPAPWDWSAPRPGPAASSATSATISPPASSASPRSRSRPGRPATSSPAPTCAGWKSSGPWRSSRTSSRRFPTGRFARTSGRLKPDHLVVSLVEGWRGEICHVALTDGQGRFCPLQDRRPVVPQLDGPGDGAARPADLRLPAVQQELQPVVLRTRPVRRDVMLQVFACPSAAGPPHDRLPGAEPPPLPDRFRGLPVVDASKCPDGCRACAEACPTDAITDRRRRACGSTWAAACSAPTACEACPEGAIRYTPGLPPGHADAARTWSCDGRTLKLAEALDEKIAPALRPLAQAPPGQRRRLQRLRGRPERPGHRRLRPGPVRHPVRRLAAPRRRPRRHRPGQREHAARPCWTTYAAVPAPKLVIAVGAVRHQRRAFPWTTPRSTTAADRSLPVDLYIPGCPPHPLTILDGLLRLLGRLERNEPRTVPATAQPDPALITGAS